MKLEEKNKARQLRQEGLSLKQIAAALDVSKGSVSAWVRDIELSDGLLGNIHDQRRLAREHSRITRLSNIADKNKEISLKCKEEILPLFSRDLWVSGLLLYAGEGYKSKTVSGQRVELANSDPNILRLFISFLLSVCSVPKNKIIIRIMLYEDIDLKEAQKYWSEELGIPESQFRKPFIKQSFRNMPYRHLRRSEYGTVHVHVYDVILYRKIMGWINAIYEYNNLNFNKA